MKINLRATTIASMLHFLRSLKSGQATKEQLVEIFNHPDYDFEFRRYFSMGQSATKEEITDYFFNLTTITPDKIPALRPSRPTELQDRHMYWLMAIENLDKLEGFHSRLNSLISPEMLAEATELVKRGLPDDFQIGTIDIIFTIGIGGSVGYVYDGAFHLDFLALTKMNIGELVSILAHESHHVATMEYADSYQKDFSPEEWFIHFFTGEGLAVKFCNNGSGIFTKPIYTNRPPNEGLDKFTMEYLNGKFDEALATFNATLTAIHNGEMTKDDVWKHLMEYWFNFHTTEQQPDEPPKLQHSLAYSFGNDFYGIIYDTYGKEVLFDCVRHPLKAVEYFNKIGR